MKSIDSQGTQCLDVYGSKESAFVLESTCTGCLHEKFNSCILKELCGMYAMKMKGEMMDNALAQANNRFLQSFSPEFAGPGAGSLLEKICPLAIGGDQMAGEIAIKSFDMGPNLSLEASIKTKLLVRTLFSTNYWNSSLATLAKRDPTAEGTKPIIDYDGDGLGGPVIDGGMTPPWDYDG